MNTSYTIKLSNVHLAIADVISISYCEYLLTRINVPVAYRQRGIANKLLSLVLNDAHNENICLFVEVSPSDGMNYIQLCSWYEKHGFKKSNAIGDNVFVRHPTQITTS